MSAPLDLREIFARAWSGEATIRSPWWLRWIPFLPTGFTFRTEAAPVEGVAALP